MEDTIVTAVSQVGFPIVVALYVLVRMERRIERLTAAINRWADALHSHQNNEGD